MTKTVVNATFEDIKAIGRTVDPRADMLFVDISAQASYTLISVTDVYLGGYPLPSQAYEDSVSVAESLMLQLSKGITSDSVSFTEAYNLLLDKGITPDTLTTADTYLLTVGKVLAETTLLSDSADVALYNPSSILNGNIIGEFTLNY